MGYTGWLKMLSIRVDSMELTQIIQVDWSLWPRFKNEEGSCIIISRILTSGRLYRVVENVVDSSRFDWIDMNHFSCCRFVMPEVNLHVLLFHGWAIQGGWKRCQFESIRSNWHESYKSTEVCGHVLRTRKVRVSLFHGSWLPVGYTGWLKMLSIRVDSIELTWIVSPVVDSSCRKSICMYCYFTDLDFQWAIQGGWKCCRFKSIRSNRHESFLLLLICHAGSRFGRRDSVRIELKRNMRIESNCKVPQMNRLCLGVLDMDGNRHLSHWWNSGKRRWDSGMKTTPCVRAQENVT